MAREDGPTRRETTRTQTGIPVDPGKVHPSPLGPDLDRPPAAPECRLPVLIEGRYLLQEKLGEGGMGEVFGGVDRRVEDRPVALKFIRRGRIGEESFRYFCNEIRSLAELRHEGIVRIFDTGALDLDRPYFVMERIDGLPFDRFLKERQPALDVRLRVFVEVCHAVQHLHEKGLIHRDLKPANILIRGPDLHGRHGPVVVDFGIAVDYATLAKDPREASILIVGTPAFMSPEQVLLPPAQLDRRSDIYALGIILYYLLTETLPYEVSAADYGALVRAVCESAIVPPRDHRRGMPGDLQAIALKALERDRRERYSSADELADHLQRFIDGRPVPLMGNPIYVARKVLVRHPVVASCLGVLTALVVALGVLSVRSDRIQSRFLHDQLAILNSIGAGRYEEARRTIEDALVRLPEASEKRLVLTSLRDQVVLRELQKATGVVGATFGPVGPSDFTLDGVTRSVGEPWRSQEARETVGRTLAALVKDGHSFEPYPPPEVDPVPCIRMAGLLVDLDQYQRARRLLDRVPQGSRGLWHYRYLEELLRTRACVGQEGERKGLEAAEMALEQLCAEADRDPELASEVPHALFNRAIVLRRLGRADEAMALLRAAVEHPLADEDLRSLRKSLEGGEL